jgi:hypothetical protein
MTDVLVAMLQGMQIPGVTVATICNKQSGMSMNISVPLPLREDSVLDLDVLSNCFKCVRYLWWKSTGQVTRVLNMNE